METQDLILAISCIVQFITGIYIGISWTERKYKKANDKLKILPGLSNTLDILINCYYTERKENLIRTKEKLVEIEEYEKIENVLDMLDDLEHTKRYYWQLSKDIKDIIK